MNKLINEKSPYLQQHSSNPVDWYPWGDEAFDKAKSENKPIFVSIGYATCHWCHVMAHESFEDVEVAEILNKNFISVKVDREERPDIDSIYMTVCQMMTGQGGWPLSIFISPDKEPFFAGTYFPKESRGQRMGFIDLLTRINDVWQNKRSEVQTTLDNVKTALIQAKGTQTSTATNASQITSEVFLQKINEELKEFFDHENGGFGTHPKFPSSHKLQFLLDQYSFTGDTESLKIVEKTLFEMHRGGFYDHIGGGVHRYSTDESWELPHFEKMLYDQANCAMSYTLAYQITNNVFYKKIAEDILNFCIRDLKLPTGGFASAYDADSEGEEGKFYVWSFDELNESLSEKEFDFLKQHYNLKKEGNFKDESTGELVDKNIFFLKKSFFDSSGNKNLNTNSNSDLFFQEFELIKQKLLNIRNKRIKPLLDEKILCDWNGFLAAVLFRAGFVFENKRYTQEAENILDFLERNLEADGLYFHRYCDGDTLKISFLDDQSYMMWAFLEGYRSTQDKVYLEKLENLFDVTTDKFKDSSGPGLFLTPENQEVVVTRTKELYDGAHPSGAAVYFYTSIFLARLTRNDEILASITEQLDKLRNEFVYSASSFCFWGLSYLLLNNSYEEVHLKGATDKNKKDISNLLKKNYHASLIFHGDNVFSFNHELLNQKTEGSTKVLDNESSQLQIFVCKDYACRLPMTTVTELEKMMQKH